MKIIFYIQRIKLDFFVLNTYNMLGTHQKFVCICMNQHINTYIYTYTHTCIRGCVYIHMKVFMYLKTYEEEKAVPIELINKGETLL